MNVYITGSPDERTFQSRYGEYEDTPFFEEAKKVYLHKTINSRNAHGVNTWHEQLIAGNITPADMKTLGYSNIARFITVTPEILIQMTKEKDPLSAEVVRAAMDAAKTSKPHDGSKENTAPTLFRHTLFIAANFGVETVRSVSNHESIRAMAQNLLMPLLRTDPELAHRVVTYVDEFVNEIRTLLAGGTEITGIYGDNDFKLLMAHNVSPKEAALSLSQGLSAERAVEARKVTRSIAEGVL